jgi:acyl carrier protein
MLKQAEVRAVVIGRMGILLLEETDEAVAVKGGDQLHELAFNSLLLARLIIQLESAVGVDPFASEVASIADMRSVDDLVGAYESAVAQAAGAVPALAEAAAGS